MLPHVFHQHVRRMYFKLICKLLVSLMKVCTQPYILIEHLSFPSAIDQLLDHHFQALPSPQQQVLTVIYANLARRLEKLLMLCLEITQLGSIIIGTYVFYLVNYR